jgi:hypothetical protein
MTGITRLAHSRRGLSCFFSTHIDTHADWAVLEHCNNPSPESSARPCTWNYLSPAMHCIMAGLFPYLPLL